MMIYKIDILRKHQITFSTKSKESMTTFNIIPPFFFFQFLTLPFCAFVFSYQRERESLNLE
jgi:hypothetical protein